MIRPLAAIARAWRARAARVDWSGFDALPLDPVAAEEQDCINNGPTCQCGCPRAAHQGSRPFPYITGGHLGYFDGPCSNPACPTGCPEGYWPGNGAPYASLFPAPEVYRRPRRRR